MAYKRVFFHAWWYPYFIIFLTFIYFQLDDINTDYKRSFFPYRVRLAFYNKFRRFPLFHNFLIFFW